jgi:hypothetical protein
MIKEYGESVGTVYQLRSRPRALRAAIRKYGQHSSSCMGYEGVACTCGFEAIFDACSPASGGDFNG